MSTFPLLTLWFVPLVLCGQATLPPASPTAPAAVTASPAQAARRHAQVLFHGGVLTIHAENASLNGLLREIASSTGMRITGGVVDERVYGNYGPADTGTVLAALLAGTGSNMLLQESAGDQPLTLVLTPRQGGPTPPSPSSFAPEPAEDGVRADLPPQQTRPTPAPVTIAPAPQSTPTPTVPADAASGATGAPDSNTTTQQSPNGVKTPQQIYDQLMKLKQQQQTTPQTQ